MQSTTASSTKPTTNHRTSSRISLDSKKERQWARALCLTSAISCQPISAGEATKVLTTAKKTANRWLVNSLPMLSCFKQSPTKETRGRKRKLSNQKDSRKMLRRTWTSRGNNLESSKTSSTSRPKTPKLLFPMKVLIKLFIRIRRESWRRRARDSHWRWSKWWSAERSTRCARTSRRRAHADMETSACLHMGKKNFTNAPIRKKPPIKIS